ncbi:MAG: ERCC4 domain-containing protein [Candidatus Eisenbacteria bacterium]
MTVVVDSRERAPYHFDPVVVATTKRALPAGDYSLCGCETEIAVERKSLEDFVSTVVYSRDRFKRELERLRGYRLACVIVEGDLRDIVLGRYRSRAHPNAILASALAIYVDYGIPVFFCSDREIASRFVLGMLLRYQKERKLGTPVEEKGATAP